MRGALGQYLPRAELFATFGASSDILLSLKVEVSHQGRWGTHAVGRSMTEFEIVPFGHLRLIKMGKQYADGVEILSGINDKDRIVHK